MLLFHFMEMIGRLQSQKGNKKKVFITVHYYDNIFIERFEENTNHLIRKTSIQTKTK